VGVIRYHGTPFTPNTEAIKFFKGRHALVSFYRPDQIQLVAEVAESFVIDNGAFSHWRNGGGKISCLKYSNFVCKWYQHPGFDWCLIPDVIGGSEKENDLLIEKWEFDKTISVPVWHLHESLPRLKTLVKTFPRVAFGSSGKYRSPGTDLWWGRMDQAMRVACDGRGRPLTKLHGLRQLNNTILSHIPYASADSATVGRNLGNLDKDQTLKMSKGLKALIHAERLESHATAVRWTGKRGTAQNRYLIG
jgi:hypothetical protein